MYCSHVLVLTNMVMYLFSCLCTDQHFLYLPEFLFTGLQIFVQTGMFNVYVLIVMFIYLFIYVYVQMCIFLYREGHVYVQMCKFMYRWTRLFSDGHVYVLT